MMRWNARKFKCASLLLGGPTYGLANLLALMIVVAFPMNAFAFCSAPTAPDAPSLYGRPTKPQVPYCVDVYSRTHTCDDWQIDSYNAELANYQSELDLYFRRLKSYVSEADSFAADALAYAQCEIRMVE